jgi:hypothetical protein
MEKYVYLKIYYIFISMELSVFLVEYNNKSIGIWQTFEQANQFILGCLQNNLMTNSQNPIIKTFNLNTCYCSNIKLFNKQNINQDNNIKPNNNNQIIKPITKKETRDFNNPALIEMAKQKVEIQHKINLLKKQKVKIEESKQVYENDLKLFELFNENKIKDESFVIPDIFIKKYELMNKLKSENNLSWENFIKEYQHDNLYNEYFGLTSYDETFIDSNNDSDNSDISEELDIETDSDTELSVSSK